MPPHAPTTLEQYVADREAVLGEVRRMLIEKLRVAREPDEIDPDTALFGTGLGFDSIDAVELLVCLSADFDVKLPDDTLGRAEMRTVNAIVNLVLARREAEPARA